MYAITEASPLLFETFKVGKEGWAVIACQDALNTHYPSPPLKLDGYFGQQTEKIAKEVQTACHILADGIVGPQTQEAFLRAKCKHGEKGVTPAGLLIGICNIESSYSWPCVSEPNEDGSQDVGTTQVNLKKSEWTTGALLGAFNPDYSAHVLAGETSGFHKAFLQRVGDQRAWELAALAHNWPAAAYALARGEQSWLDKPFAFTTIKGYDTGLDYANYYIGVATAQVAGWAVP